MKKRLLIERHIAAVFNPEMCKFGNKSWAAMSTDVQDAAKYLFEMKLKKELLARLAAANTIGYALKTDQRKLDPKSLLTKRKDNV